MAGTAAEPPRANRNRHIIIIIRFGLGRLGLGVLSVLKDGRSAGLSRIFTARRAPASGSRFDILSTSARHGYLGHEFLRAQSRRELRRKTGNRTRFIERIVEGIRSDGRA